MSRILLALTAVAIVIVVSPSPATAQTREDTIVFALGADIGSYDMHNHAMREAIIAGYHLFDALVVREQATRAIVPHLATGWRTVDDLTWEFKLRRDVRFHDGDPFTAHTVKFNLDRVLDPAQRLAQRGNYAMIRAVELVDDFTVRLRTAAPYPLLLDRLSVLPMLSERAVPAQGREGVAERPVGTGPYRFVSWKRGQEHLWARNDDYWGPKPAFRHVRVRIIPEQATQIAELLSGGVDVVRTVPLDQVDVIERSGVARTVAFPILRTGFIVLDAAGRTGSSPFQDPRVRRAVNLGTDVDGIVKHVLRGLVDRTATVVSPLAFGYDASIKPYPYDPEGARKLLAAAGYPNGFEVRFLGFRADLAPTHDVVAADLSRIGITVRPQLTGDIRTFITRVREGKAGPMFDWTWGYYSIFDADAILFDNFHCGQPSSYYCTAELDGLIDAARATMDQARRRELYARAQRLLHEDAAALFKWNYRRVWGISNRIEYSPPFDEIDRLFAARPRGAARDAPR